MVLEEVDVHFISIEICIEAFAVGVILTDSLLIWEHFDSMTHYTMLV